MLIISVCVDEHDDHLHRTPKVQIACPLSDVMSERDGLNSGLFKRQHKKIKLFGLNWMDSNCGG